MLLGSRVEVKGQNSPRAGGSACFRFAVSLAPAMSGTVESTRKMTLSRNCSSLTLLGFWLVGGCASLSGTWRAVEIDPPNATGVIRTMTFDGQRYTATADEGAKRQTTTGDFGWNGSRLTLRATGGPVLVFSGRKGGGQLTLLDDRPEGQVRTTFEKISE